MSTILRKSKLNSLEIHLSCGYSPRLELQSGSLNDLRSILCELAKNAKLEMKRGNKGAVEEMLQVFIESGEKFSTFEKKIVEKDRGFQPFAGHSKGLPFVAEGSQ